MNDIQDCGDAMERPAGHAQTLYLITGADGFIGREIASQLRARGDRVRGLLLCDKPQAPMPDGVELVTGDVLIPEKLAALFAGTRPGETVVIHTAAVISVRRRGAYCERVNIAGTENIITACRKFGARRLVHFGTVDALPLQPDGMPITEPDRFSPEGLPTAYGRSKAVSSQYVLDTRGLSCAQVLPAAVIGPGDYRKGFITRMIGMYLDGLPRLSVEGGYEFVDVRDVAAAAITAADKEMAGGCYILSNRYISVTEVFDTLAAVMGRKPTRRTLPLWVLYPLTPLISAAFRLAGLEPPLTGAALKLMRCHPAYCHDRAARELGFSPRSIEQSLADTAAFIMTQRGR